jgi:hypothetical protein
VVPVVDVDVDVDVPDPCEVWTGDEALLLLVAKAIVMPIKAAPATMSIPVPSSSRCAW